jgi:hypothetical protein
MHEPKPAPQPSLSDLSHAYLRIEGRFLYVLTR